MTDCARRIRVGAIGEDIESNGMSFFWSLKHEWTKFEAFADLQEAQLSVFEYIEMFYNTTRIHQTVGYKTPDAYEALRESNLAS